MTAPDFYYWLFTSLFVVMWVGWFVLWRVMAFRVKATAQSENVASRLSHIVPLIFAGYLLAPPSVPLPLLNVRFVPLAIWPSVLGAALTFAGLLFCVWARVVLAGNWSDFVQIKQDHELIVEGPYRWVRHPIYTGLILMFAGTALAVGEWRGVLAVVIAVASFWRKLRLEETVMRRQFGATYGVYAERVPALIPFVL
jgi:protein-S-isoprenylcysteine O-methyltransferase Ste14